MKKMPIKGEGMNWIPVDVFSRSPGVERVSHLLNPVVKLFAFFDQIFNNKHKFQRRKASHDVRR
jgi:hypothetical protein